MLSHRGERVRERERGGKVCSVLSSLFLSLLFPRFSVFLSKQDLKITEALLVILRLRNGQIRDKIGIIIFLIGKIELIRPFFG